MEKKAKSNSVVSTKVDGEKLIFLVKGTGEAILDLTLLSESNRWRAVLHGLTQKVCDAAALSRDTTTGKSASPADKLAAMVKVVEHLNSGTEEWNLKREGGGGPSVETTLLVKALVELYPAKPEADIAKWLKARKPEERAALMGQANIKGIVDRLRAEAGKAVDTEELLSGLMDDGEGEAE